MKIHFAEFLNLADDVHPGLDNQNCHDAFLMLFRYIKDTELMKGSLYDLLKGLDKKLFAFSALVDVIKEPELMKAKIIDVLNLLENILEEEYEWYGSSVKNFAYAKLIEKLNIKEININLKQIEIIYYYKNLI